MKKRLFVGCLVCILLANVKLLAQGYVVSPVVPNFTDINANWVVATSGSTDDPFTHKGILPNRHQVVSIQGTDYYTGNMLKYLPQGESKVIKLGNSQVGSEAESITYHFIVDPAKAVLLLKFAVVFEDPSHPGIYQPRFVVRIMNKDGELIDACAEYDVSARAEIEGFQTYDKLGIPIRWRDWTSVGLDMSAYAGQEVQVQFATYDCALNAHFGYAYFTASCISHQLVLENCKDDEFTLSAPGSFVSYLWQDGRTEPSTVWKKGDEDMNLACEITSATGCHFTLSAFVTADNKIPVGPEIYDTICQGETYVKYNYNLPPQAEVGSFRYSNTYFNSESCTAGATSVLFLTVLQRYYPIVEELCPGESYVANGFNYENPSPGLYLDSLYYSREGGKCDSVVTLQLTVFPEVTTSGNIKGEVSPCVGSIQIYSMSENWEQHSYSWQFPEGFYVLGGQGTPNVTVQVTDVAQSGSVALALGTKGCAFGLVPFTVEPNPAYWQTLNDSVCTGVEYRENGFNVSRQDSSGIRTFTQYNKTTHGCDSIVTLNLYVFKTPGVSVTASADVLCGGEQVKLEAIGEGAHFMPDTVAIAIAIGDILCTDGTVEKAKAYKGSGKVAKGIVFYVDPKGKHGWAVHLRQQSRECRWGYYTHFVDIPGLTNYSDSHSVASDTSGYNNTKTIRAAGNAAVYQAAYLVDFDKGWYIPAAGQILQLYAYVPEINTSLRVTGGDLFQFDGDWYFWSSSENNHEYVWALTYQGTITIWGKYPNKEIQLRSVCSF